MTEPTPIDPTAPDGSEARIARLEAEVARLQRIADETREEFDGFAYSVSHDLRAPLRALNGFSKLLADEAAPMLTEETSDYLQRIVGATRRLELLIEDLLALSRAGRAEMRTEQIDLGGMAREVAAALAATAPQRAVDWRIDAARVQGDPALLRILLEHLLGNAFKFTRLREQAVIELRIDGEAADDAPVTCFSVRDNGVGFDMAYAERLFAPFQRFHPANAFEGNGIGLASVRRIARRHGGRAWLESAPDRGTEAFVSLWETATPA